MKILELRFKNLNSLYGEWVIDFSHPEFVSNGIFALTGPTGAGKTTILDAVCLALYGATPRLGKITAGSNEIMSRQTGECYAEVLFESRTGRFRCHWEQRRARKNPAGKLQDQEHQLIDADTGKPMESKKSLVVKAIETQTGMDFDRFTRSILLAQGSFDSFLKADAEQKSRILEQITGTGIYSEISRRVHQRRSQEREQLQLLQVQTAAISLLDPDQEKNLRQELETKRPEQAVLELRCTETAKTITWFGTVSELQQELESIAAEEARLDLDLQKFEPLRNQLEDAARAAGLDGPYARLSAMRDQLVTEQRALATEETSLPVLEQEAATRNEALVSAQKHTAKAKEELQNALPLVRQVTALDQKLGLQSQAISETETALSQDRSKIEAAYRDRTRTAKHVKTVEEELQQVTDYLFRHQQDQVLLSGLAGIEEQVAGLVAARHRISQIETERRQAEDARQQASQRHAEAVKHRNLLQNDLDRATTGLHGQQEALLRTLNGRTLAEYRSEKESLLLQLSFLNKVVELEELRTKLEDGSPCPLCGSREHPFARGNIPVADETERKIQALTTLIETAETHETAVKNGQESRMQVQAKLVEAEKSEAAATNELLNAEKKHQECTENLARHQANDNAAIKALSSRLAPLGITEIPEPDLDSLLESLRSRLDRWQAQSQRKSELEKHGADHRAELKRLNSVIEIQNQTVADKQQRLQSLQAEYREVRRQREELYGDKSPEAEERRLGRAVTSAEERERETALGANRSLQALQAAKARIESLATRIETSKSELRQLLTEFTAALQEARFSDENQFLEARLERGRRSSLEMEAKTLDRRKQEVTARKNERQSRLAKETAKKLSSLTLEEVVARQTEDEQKLQELREAIAGLSFKLAENQAAGERLAQQLTVVEAHRKECARWEKLHLLIGSADGKKYRNFAQSLTFELLVSQANVQLKKMTDRYLLVLDQQEPLALNVIDDYQAGEIRSTRNLSGGESFIVSLALALGLSRMASRNVRVDSLFLDEGFGTLDEEALETALETLSELQQEGKLIGVISHVAALHERIDTQVSIAPVAGGRSLLAGPGCSRITAHGNRQVHGPGSRESIRNPPRQR